MNKTKLEGNKKSQLPTPYKINCWLLAYLRKSKRTFLVHVLFSELVAQNTQLTLHKHVVANKKPRL